MVFQNLIALSVLFLSSVLIPPARAGQLATLDAFSGMADYGSMMTSAWLRVTLSDPTWGCWTDSPPSFCYQIWYKEISSASVGQTIVIDESTNPEFAAIAMVLANGANDWICFSVDRHAVSSSGGGVCYYESRFTGASALYGAIITSISLTVNDVSFGTTTLPVPFPGSGLVQGSSAQADVTMSIDAAAIPEPHAVGIVACGLLVMLVSCRVAGGRAAKQR